MPISLSFSDIRFGRVYLDPVVDASGDLVGFNLSIDAGLQEDTAEDIVVHWGNYDVPLTEVEKAQVLNWLITVIKPKVKAQLGL